MVTSSFNERGRREKRGYAGVLSCAIGDSPASPPEKEERRIEIVKPVACCASLVIVCGFADYLLCRDLCATTRGTLAKELAYHFNCVILHLGDK